MQKRMKQERPKIKQKKIPERMCASCRGRFPRKDLIRFVENQEGIWQLDPGGKADGRGIYLCHSKECLLRITGQSRKLPFRISEESKATLLEWLNQARDNPVADQGAARNTPCGDMTVPGSVEETAEE